jgi:uncharacterized protein YoxC
MKRGKCRYRRTDVNYFVQELVNGFYIEDDLLTDHVNSKAAIMPVADKEVKEISESVKKEFDKPIGDRGTRVIRDVKKEKVKKAKLVKLEDAEVDNLIEDILGKAA